MNQKIIDSFIKLRDYCEREDYRGWDPYDGLNSRVFKAIPGLRHSAVARLIMIQTFKRCPVNLRRLFMVPKEHNAKGIGLFLQGYTNLYNLVTRNPQFAAYTGSADSLKIRIESLAELLISIRSVGYSGACWGYNFDWQQRRNFLFPAYTPTVVATNFCATALIEAARALGRDDWREVALSSSAFVLNDLHRSPQPRGGFLFSYGPLKGHDTVYNASLLGSRLLSYCYAETGDTTLKDAARQSIIACVDGQAPDGSWPYGMLPEQKWIDSFHTGYNLDGLVAYQRNTGDTTFADAIDKGFDYYIANMFESDGTPKYYNNRTYPIDIHCPGQLFVTLSRMERFNSYRNLADRVMDWCIDNMQAPEGYFYYQLKAGISSKISYMRWSNAFMFAAMSYYLLETQSCH